MPVNFLLKNSGSGKLDALQNLPRELDDPILMRTGASNHGPKLSRSSELAYA
jgi:hypothetical protein